MRDIYKASFTKRLDHLLTTISSERFLKKQGLANEVPFFICHYDPSESIDMDRLRKQLVNKLDLSGVKVLEINLYDLTLEIIHVRGIWNQLIETEHEVEKSQFIELLQGILDPQDYLIPAISRKMEENSFNVMFLSGIGEIFPYIRSHTVLNNLQKAAKVQPTVMFFPGKYTQSAEKGASLDLFGILHDDKYYRAFDLYNF